MPQGNIKSRASSTDSARQCFHRKFDNFCRSKNMVINLFWTVFSPLTRIDNIECRFTYTFFPRSLYSGTFFPIDISRCCFTAWNFHSIAINTSVKSSSICLNLSHESTCLDQSPPLNCLQPCEYHLYSHLNIQSKQHDSTKHYYILSEVY